MVKDCEDKLADGGLYLFKILNVCVCVCVCVSLSLRLLSAPGLGGPSEQRFPPDLQHGAEPPACGGDQPGVHAGEVLLPVPALQGGARRGRE